jgi:hypothetical protein
VNVVVISVTKEGVKFSTRGDIGTANIVLRQNTTVDKVCYHLSVQISLGYLFSTLFCSVLYALQQYHFMDLLKGGL